MTTDVDQTSRTLYQMILRLAIRAAVPAMVLAHDQWRFTITAKLASIYLVAVLILGAAWLLFMSRASNYFYRRISKQVRMT